MSISQSKVCVAQAGTAVEMPAAKLRFSAFQCFRFDESPEEIACLTALGQHLMSLSGGLACYGTGEFLESLIKYAPGLTEKLVCVIHDEPAGVDMPGHDIKIIAPDQLPDAVETVFLSELGTHQRWRMARQMPERVEILSADILPEIAWDIVPARAWVTDSFSIYPIEIPDIEFEKNQDLILIDSPARNLALMPNGLAYVHNALKKTKVKYQTVDTDIIIYHRYHARRIFDQDGRIFLPSGKEMPTDPWQAEHYELWEDEEVIDYFRPEIDEIIARLIEANPKILAMSIQQCNETFSRQIVQGVRKELPEIIVLVGGFSCYNPDVGRKAFLESDYMCIGEADLVVGPLVENILRGERLNHIPGVLSRYDEDDYEYVPGPMPHNLDFIEFPKYEWCDINLYRNFNAYQLTPVLASRGCRWSRCTFCAERFYWRIRSPKNFVDELEWLVDRGCNLFMFNESDLNGMPEKLMEICDEIIDRKLPIKLAGQLRIHKKSDRAFFDKLHKAGVVALRFGIDALSKNTLRLQKKGYTVDTISQNLKDCTESGIYTEVNWVIGVPGETEQDVDEGIELILKNQKYVGRLANINKLVLANGSVYWLDPDSHKIKFNSDKDQLYRDHARAIPASEWYSEDPFIDDDVRQKWFIRIVTGLHEAGFDVGPWASKVIAATLEAGNPKSNADPEKEAPAFQANSMVASPAAPAAVDAPMRLIRFDDAIYGIDVAELEKLLNGTGEIDILWAEDHDGAAEFIASYGEFNMVSYRGKFYGCPHGLMLEWPKVEQGIYPGLIVCDSFAELRDEVALRMRERGVELRPERTAATETPKVRASGAMELLSGSGMQRKIRTVYDSDIYYYEGSYYGVPTSLGDVRFDITDPTTMADVISDVSFDAVEAEILDREQLAASEPAE
jgi:radical SAM superfamily enzyme YgiQ (UPF0313 family)